MKLKSHKIEHGIILILIFLAAMNFYSKFFYFAFSALFVMLVAQKRLKINNASILYFLLGLLMGIYNSDDGLIAMLRCFAYVACYWVGYNSIVTSRKSQEAQKTRLIKAQKYAYALLTAIASGSFVHFLLNYISNMGQDLGRNTNDIWTGEIMSATVQASLACVMVGLSSALILYPRKKYGRYLGIIITGCILAYNLVLSGRTVLVIYLLVLSAGIIFLIRYTKNWKKKVKIITYICCILFILVLMYRYNVFGIKDTIMDSNLYLRFWENSKEELLDSGREQKKMDFIRNLYKYPFGGLHLRPQFGYAHDLLLDAYDEYGVFAFMILLVILFNGIKELYYLCKHTQYDLEYKVSFLCVYIAILLEFCVEPIFAGLPWLFACYSLINGCIVAMNRMYLREQKRGLG